MAIRPRVTAVGLIVLPDPAENFIYPAHIDRSSLDALPPAPGVYLFLGEHDVPLYIGKSVNIRTRVLSHLRTPQEAAMLAATQRVEFARTAGEIGALLFESQLIKRLQPTYNVLLRYAGETFAIRITGDSLLPHVVGSRDTDSDDSSRYGLFPSRAAAQQELEMLVRRHMLCPARVGLEKTTRGRACFAYQIGRCRGACAGKETLQEHDARLKHALEWLEFQVWPYNGPIGIAEEGGGLRQVHIVDRWSYLGTLQGRRKTFRRPARKTVDIDVYKILANPLRKGELKIVDVSSAQR